MGGGSRGIQISRQCEYQNHMVRRNNLGVLGDEFPIPPGGTSQLVCCIVGKAVVVLLEKLYCPSLPSLLAVDRDRISWNASSTGMRAAVMVLVAHGQLPDSVLPRFPAGDNYTTVRIPGNAFPGYVL
jgi:hypothetical protein